MDKAQAIKICETIAEDCEKDAKKFDGQPFTGKTVATYFGYQGAAIAALSNVLKTLIENEQKKDLTLL